MTFIFPFMYQPVGRPNDEPYLVYAVNEDDPENVRRSYTQGYWKCTHCEEGSQYRFYDDGPNYQAKCPKCRKEFIAIDDTDWED
jgi:hypothetical protein